MNLKTHTAYPEVHVNEHGVFTVKLIDSAGATVFEDMGAGKGKIDINQRVAKMIDEQEPKYRNSVGNKIKNMFKGES